MRLAFTIEPAGAAHVGAMATIYREQIAEGLGTWEDPMPGSAEIGRRLAAVNSVGLPAYVGLDALGRVVGFSWVRPFRDRAAYRSTVEDSIFVASGARRQGVGRRLLGAVIEASTRLGYQQMMALVGDARNLPSIRLHQSLGFMVVGYLPGAGSKPGGSVDVVLLQRNLREHRPAAGGVSSCSDSAAPFALRTLTPTMLG